MVVVPLTLASAAGSIKAWKLAPPEPDRKPPPPIG